MQVMKYVFQPHGDERGQLVALEEFKDIPFRIKRVRLDNGKEKKIIPLEKPYEGLYVSNAIWREMFDFSSDAVLMVLASELYDEEDYIRNYDDFLEYVKNRGVIVTAKEVN